MKKLVHLKFLFIGTVFLMLFSSSAFPGISNSSANELIVELEYSTFFGGNEQVWSNAIVLDSQKNIIISGWVENKGNNFATTGSYNTTRSGANNDLFVAKFSPDGTKLLFSTYIGGSDVPVDSQKAIKLAVTTNDDIWIATSSERNDFPTVNSLNSSVSGDFDVVLCKLASDGSELLYSTFIGGSNGDIVSDLVLDGQDNIYLSGTTLSPDFPTTSNAFNDTLGGLSDSFVLKLTSTADQIIYSTYIGGSDEEGYLKGITVDGDGVVYLVGTTISSDFPITADAYDDTFSGAETLSFGTLGDAFLVKLASNGSSLLYSSFFGGSKGDGSWSVKLDSHGNIVILGQTTSKNLPVTQNALYTNLNPQDSAGVVNHDLFVSKFSSNGSSLLYSTYIGGLSQDWAWRQLTLDSFDNIVIAGAYNPPGYPTTGNALNTGSCNKVDGFISIISANGDELLFSSNLCGSEEDEIWNVVVDGNKVYLSGFTNSRDFPITNNAYQENLANTTSQFYLRNNFFSILSVDYGIQTTTPPTTTTVLDTSSSSPEVHTSSESSTSFQSSSTSENPTTSNSGGIELLIFSIGSLLLLRRLRKK